MAAALLLGQLPQRGPRVGVDLSDDRHARAPVARVVEADREGVDAAAIGERYRTLAGEFDERRRRLWAAEALDWFVDLARSSD